MAKTTHYRACHLCEAICGLAIEMEDDQVVSIKGDPRDPLSQGYICPKATAIMDLQTDPDRLTMPVKKVAGEWKTISWEEAFSMAAEALVTIQQHHGDNAVGVYAGNPNVHNYGSLTHGPLLRRALGTKNNFSATSLDQLPHHFVALLMYGHQFFLPIPDVDHTQFLLILGGNPLVSNGSIMTMPNAKKRLKAIQERGGRFTVVDPRRTETADIADTHLPIVPGTDAFLLMSIIRQLLATIDTSNMSLAQLVDGVEVVRAAVEPFTVALAAKQTGIAEEQILLLIDQLASTPRAVVYGRMGVSVQAFGGLCQWAIQVINILIGALDNKGGARLTSPAFASVRQGTPSPGHFNRFQSRVRGLPEFGGELPAITMAEEILTEGEGQIRAMITIAGNPIISSANATALETAFCQLDFYLAIDPFINATTRHADLILPPTMPWEHDHFDIAFLRLAVRDVARYNPAIFAPTEGALHDWQIMNGLADAIAQRKGTAFRPLPSPDLLVAQGIAMDMYSEKYNPEIALTMEKLKQYPHGLDLGPLKPGIGQRLATEDGKIHLAPQIIIDDLPRLLSSQHQVEADQLLLIGRRHLRSNNSWMHNSHRLVKGKPRWQLHMHPTDMQFRQLQDGDKVEVSTDAGAVTVEVQSSDAMMQGVVSLPHGWGQNQKGVKLKLASEQGGVNSNILSGTTEYDQLTGNAILNGIAVKITAYASA